MGALLSVVVNQLNVTSVAVVKPEDTPPVRADGHCPVPLEVAFEPMQAIPGKVKSPGRRRHIENGENSLNGLHEVGADSAPVALLVEPSQSPIA